MSYLKSCLAPIILTFNPDSSQPLIFLSTSDLSTSTNISWSNLSQVDSYNLTVTSKSYNHAFLEINRSSHIFISPPNAPPCDFSVTATPVGATYTGDGCSVPSNTLSVVLPSPPRLATVESSIHYYLEKQDTGGVMLNISFMVSHFNTRLHRIGFIMLCSCL